MTSKPMNKFTKSVLDREQKETPTISIEKVDTVFKEAPNSIIQTQSQKNKLSKKNANLEEKKENNAITSKKQPAEDNTFSLENFLTAEQGRQAKNKTFYLDTAVINAIKKAATINHIAESKLVNDILKKILKV